MKFGMEAGPQKPLEIKAEKPKNVEMNEASSEKRLFRNAIKSKLPYVISAVFALTGAGYLVKEAVSGEEYELKADFKSEAEDQLRRDSIRTATIAELKLKDEMEKDNFSFDSIPENLKKEAFQDLKQILPPWELKQFSAKFGKFPEVLAEDQNREYVKQLQSKFTVNLKDLEYLCYDRVEGKNRAPTFLEDLKNNQKIIEGITKVFPENFKPEVDFLPAHHIENLKDKKFVEGLKRAAEAHVYAEWYQSKQITNLAENDDWFQDLKKLSSLGIEFDRSIFYVPPSDLKSFLNNNADILPVFSGSKIGDLAITRLDTTNEKRDIWRDILTNKVYAEGITRLKAKKFSVEDVLAFKANSADSFLRNPEQIKLLGELTSIIAESDRRNIFRECDPGRRQDIGEYININTEKGIKDFRAVIAQAKKTISETGPYDYNSFRELVRQQVLNPEFKQLVSQYPKENVHYDELYDDPAFYFVVQLGYEKEVPVELQKLSKLEQAEWIIRTCRNMEALDIPATRENFSLYLKKGLELRSSPEILEQKLFTDRNVAVMANNELLSTDDAGSFKDLKRFANTKTIERIKKEHPQKCEVFRPATDAHDIEKAKKDFLNFIKSNNAVTVYADGHGSSSSIYFTGNDPKYEKNKPVNTTATYIDYTEFSHTLIDRYKNGFQDRVILVTTACYSQNFIRNLSQEIETYNIDSNSHVPLPIAVGTTEYGQLGFSDYKDPYRERFTDLLFKHAGDSPATLKEVFELEGEYGSNGLLNNVSVFVPFENKDTFSLKKEAHFQIAENEQKNTNKAHEKMFEQDLKKGLYNEAVASFYEAVQPEKATEIKENVKKKQDQA
jgi:hypothetical protein